jgi:uncharacterized protein YdeI (YjbR/CyaY-like superfamily)
MGNLGKITSLKDLPGNRIMKSYMLHAMDLIDQGKTLPKKQPAATSVVTIPADLKKALRENLTAQSNFSAMPPSHKKEYINWINEAKREETRIRRIESTVRNAEEGKGLNWKYEAKIKRQ